MKHFLTCAPLMVGLAACFAGARATAADPRPGDDGELLVYVGTYTRGASEGIYLFHLDLATGELRPAGLAAETVNPSFLAIHPSQKWLYAVGVMTDSDDKKIGAVRSFSIDRTTGKLSALGAQPSEGTGPCHLVVDRSGGYVLVANYGSGSAACLPIGRDGRLAKATSIVQHEGSSVDPRRQKGPHAHSINQDAAGRRAFVADLGLDQIVVYRLDAASGKLTPNDPPFASMAPGAGPRHFAFHPGGQFAYAINELNSTVTAMAYDAERGTLDPVQTLSTLPEGFDGPNTTADVHVHPSGRFLYGSNRGQDSIAIFAVDLQTGKLRYLGYEPTQGETPRNFGIDPTGAYLLAANQATDNIVVLRIDKQTGDLVPTGHSVEIPSPVCVKMMRLNR